VTFQVDDFEAAATGSLPGDWSGFTDNTGPTEVSEDRPIEGQKSALFRDEGRGWTGLRHPVGDETIIWAIDINRDTELVGSYRQIVIGVRDSGGDFVWQYAFTDDGSGDFDIHFSDTQDSRLNRQNEDSGGFDATFVGTTAVGFHEMTVEEPQNNLRLFIDDSSVHDPPASYTGASEIEWASDDMEVRIDASVGFSELVFEEGKRAIRGSATHNYVFESPEGGAKISNRGDSEFVFLNGEGMGRET
jgi:hypothetical protein